MREIKFRAWLKYKKEMVDNARPDFFSKQLHYLRDNGAGGKDILGVSTEDIELMQYTGLKDKNNKEIYEGDIVKFEDCYFDRKDSFYNIGVIQREGKTDELVIGQLLYKKTDFDENYMNYIEQTFEVCEVIGNIYENSELLGGQ